MQFKLAIDRLSQSDAYYIQYVKHCYPRMCLFFGTQTLKNTYRVPQGRKIITDDAISLIWHSSMNRIAAIMFLLNIRTAHLEGTKATPPRKYCSKFHLNFINVTHKKLAEVVTLMKYGFILKG